ncbi:Por secretion system C-terminal sorting domain-containing protein [Catalinimonas alkaloidigena]|uniref:Por secretion system C-terminal sorting domain-containing protein n=1 Tax=Catalinimonas alkaloidigena TaxID=1075417 RepID=A0A1G9MUP3_9BACT|nr:T9SS type A sorting domain-containing protein [Catalinimonas alkaloidigena]SDL77637.1 Por secretion system C-terminal sorting domain-containing protein [Catalinimonas alkaloidigena]
MKIQVLQWAAALMISCYTLPTLAQDQTTAPGSRKEARQQVMTYVKENVVPVMSAQRTKLDAQLAKADKTKLESLKADLKEIRDARKSLRGDAREKGQKRPELTEEQQAAFRDLHYRQQIAMGQVAQLAQKYDNQIQTLFDEVAGQREQWHADLKAFREANRPERAHPEGQSGDRKRAGRAHGSRGDRAHAGPGMHLWQPASFLLWDPREPMSERGLGMSAPEAGQESRLYPNPTSGAARIAYSVEKAGTVKIEVLDRQGRVVQTLQNEAQTAGAYEKEVDLSALKGNAYFYRITTPDGVQTKKFVRQ